jgi:membrane protease YdiL (CAAX protease family)
MENVSTTKASASIAGEALANVPVMGIVIWVVVGSAIPSIASDTLKEWDARAGVVTLFLFHATVAALIGWRCRQYGITFREVLGPLRFRETVRMSLLVGTSLAVTSLGAQLVFQHVLERGGGITYGKVPTAGLGSLSWDSPLGVALTILVSVVVGPFTEEVLFRRVLIARWTFLFSLPTAILLSVCLFGVLHDRVVPATLIALYLTILVTRSGNLWVNIGAHAVLNALQSLWIVALQHQGVNAVFVSDVPLSVGLVLAGSVGLVMATKLRFGIREADPGTS